MTTRPKMKIGVVVFPGTNCDQDCAEAVTQMLGFDVQWLWHANPSDVTPDLAAILLPGGFSYGDYLRSGAIAALAPILQEIRVFAQQGRPVVGICNGFQVLTEVGLLPGALMRNDGLQFVCQQRTRLTVASTQTPFTRQYALGQTVEYPIAHGDGSYQIDAEGLKRLQDQDQVVFRYQAGVNGSVDDIAGICNPERNVLGLMPHPERNLTVRPATLATGDGQTFFASLATSLLETVTA